MVNLDHYIYKPHPRLRLPTREQAKMACATSEGEADFRKAMEDRGREIFLEETDPYRGGFEPKHWDHATKILEENDELLISGGNRSGKTEFCAKWIVKLAREKDGSRIACFHTTHQSSLQNQQPVVYKYLPAEFKRKIKGAVENVSYTQKNGFTESTFILPNGSQVWFMHYSQDRRTVEGLELDAVWADELIPMDLLETIRYRLVTRAGKLLVSFTPIEGYSLTVKDFIAGGEVTEWRDSELLPTRSNIPGGPSGKMPYLMRCRRGGSWAIWFHTNWNPYNPYEQLKKRLKGLHDGEVKIRAYGWADQSVGNAFPRFGDGHIMTPGEIPVDGRNFMVVDPAGARNWFILWARVFEEVVYIYREWPDRSMGDWTVPGSKVDGHIGPAQRSGGGGVSFVQYKDLIREKEGGEPVFLRLIDSRAGSAKLMDGTTPLEKLNMSEEGEDPMLFYPANGQKIESGVQLINDILYYDNTMPVADDNSPRLFVSANCTNLIYSMREWTGADGEKGASKDPIDCLRYLCMEDNLHAPQDALVQRGGGCY